MLIDATDTEIIKTIGHADLKDTALMPKNQVKVIAQFMNFPDGRWCRSMDFGCVAPVFIGCGEGALC